MVACDTVEPSDKDKTDNGGNTTDNTTQGDGATDGTTDGKTDGTDTGDGATDGAGDNGTVIVPTSLKINGTDISEYTIIYANNPMKAKYDRYKSLVTQDTEYDKQTAENLALLIKEKFGVTLSVKRDVDTTASAKEILIGTTNRGLTDATIDSFSSVKEYSARVNGTKLVLCGGSYGATWHAAEDFVANVLTQNAEVAEIKADYQLRAKADMLVVGCIGDSLTNGSKPSGYNSSVSDSDRRDIVSYPAVLQRMEWKDMVVYNYGLGGRTMIAPFVWTDGTGDHAWTACQYYQPCMDNAKNIDLALIMLGTNDSNRTRAEAAGYNFGTSSYKKAFKAGCKSIVDQLKEKNADMKIALLNCPVSYHSFEPDMTSYIRRYQKDIAPELGIELLDMYTATQKNTATTDYPDSLHPNDKGYTTYAVLINELIAPIVSELLGK
jgi:lysophospholipase L1-like esterase